MYIIAVAAKMFAIIWFDLDGPFFYLFQDPVYHLISCGSLFVNL